MRSVVSAAEASGRAISSLAALRSPDVDPTSGDAVSRAAAWVHRNPASASARARRGLIDAVARWSASCPDRDRARGDEIAAALHAEMPWMAPATEVVWQGLRASVRKELPGLRFDPLVLVGSPGIGKSFWARRLAHHLEVPTTSIDATGEPAAFSLVGAQRGWSSAAPDKLMQTALRDRHAGSIVIIDNVTRSEAMIIVRRHITWDIRAA